MEPDRVAVAAAFAYTLGAAVWCVFEAYRLAVPPFFARAGVTDPPDWFSAAQEWSGRLFRPGSAASYAWAHPVTLV